MMKPKTSILLVDDQPDFLKNLSLALEANGYCTVAVLDGVEALNALRSQQVDLILSDIGMPNMGGYQFFKQVRKNPQWAKIPFVFITGFEFLSEGEIEYGTAMGISGYLTKPICAGDVLAAVEEKLTAAQCTAS